MPWMPESVVPTRRQVLEAALKLERSALYDDLLASLRGAIIPGPDGRIVGRIRGLSEAIQEPTSWIDVPPEMILWWELIESQDDFALDPYNTITPTEFDEMRDIIYDPRFDVLLPSEDDMKRWWTRGTTYRLISLARAEEEDE